MLNLGGVLTTDNGTDATGVVGPLGATGMRGWLSGIYSKLSGTLTVAFVAAQHVIVDTAPTTPVTGTFWPPTQPVSGSVSVSNLPATQVVSGSVSVSNFPATQPVSVATMPTTPVTGTFFQATQPVSLATNTPDVTDRAARLLGHVTVDSAPTTTVTGTVTANAGTGTMGTNVAQLAGAAPSATNPLPVRITNGVTFTDTRTPIALSVSGVASVTTVALLTLNIYKAGVITSANNYTVTAGKTFRITAIQFGVRFATPSTTVTFASTTFVLRVVTTGTVTTTSGILHQDSKMAASNTPTPNSDLPIPDGFDLPAGYNFGVTHLASATTLLEDVLILGYEF